MDRISIPAMLWRPLAVWGLVASAVCSPVAGCRVRERTPVQENHTLRTLPMVEVLRERTTKAFDRAIFYKPSEESRGGPEGALAPLIVQVAGSGEVTSATFGAMVGEPGEERIDSDRPTIYVDRGSTWIGDSALEQWVYFWRYPSSCGLRRCASCSGRGVRVTLGLDGLPMVWEALSTDDDRRILFVSRSLEEAAAREFGGPHPGRTFSIERAVEEAKNVVVVRLLDDASVAMGPYVYLDAAPNRDVTTVLCRCMASQVDSFEETRYYRLVPREALGAALPPPLCKVAPDLMPRPRIRWSGTMSVVHLDSSFATGLDKLLRWPREYR